MATFRYRAIDGAGQAVTGTAAADDLRALAEALKNQGLHLFRAKMAAGREHRTFRGRIPTRELIHFTEQLAIIIKSGIPLSSGLNDLAREGHHEGLRSVVLDIDRAVSRGVALSEAMRRYPRIFTPSYLSVVEAGEATGAMADALENMAWQMDQAQDTRRQVLGAMIQPAILLVAVMGLVVLVLTVLVPAVQDLFSRSGQQLPAVTRRLIAVSSGLRSAWKQILVALFASPWVIRGLRRIPAFRVAWDRGLLLLPVIGPVIELFLVSRFVHLFALLHQAGVHVARNLEILQATMSNAILERGVRRIREEIETGVPLGDAVRDSRVFPSLVVRMISIGERTGHLTEAMARVTHYYDRAIPRALKRITTVLQPAILLASAGLVTFVVFAAFMPMVQMISGGVR